jgi:hypothetical protein
VERQQFRRSKIDYQTTDALRPYRHILWDNKTGVHSPRKPVDCWKVKAFTLAE